MQYVQLLLSFTLFKSPLTSAESQFLHLAMISGSGQTDLGNSEGDRKGTHRLPAVEILIQQVLRGEGQGDRGWRACFTGL